MSRPYAVFLADQTGDGWWC